MRFGNTLMGSVVPVSVDLQPLTTRSVLLSTLLGRVPAQLTAAQLQRAGALFGIEPGAVRTALTRMVTAGDLERHGPGGYHLADRHLRRQTTLLAARRGEHRSWDGRWWIWVVTADGRSAADRLELRAVLHGASYAEQREGVWVRPTNAVLAPDQLAVVEQQCVGWIGEPRSDDVALAAALWDLDDWARLAVELRRSLSTFTPLRHATEPRSEQADAGAAGDRTPSQRTVRELRSAFELSARVLRHLRNDPRLPRELLPRSWPADALRADYERFERGFQRAVGGWLAE
jgi:phenylacetic acid degradation operon negative regulatory protein